MIEGRRQVIASATLYERVPENQIVMLEPDPNNSLPQG
ncbi:hypothetical protein QE152_g41311, partial [Popillia japonica]